MPIRRSAAVLLLGLASLASAKRPAQPEDLYRIREASEVELSPDGNWLAYVVQNNDHPRKVYSQIWLMSTRDGATRRISPSEADESGIRWKRDNSAFAFFSRKDEHASSIWMARPNGEREFLIEADNTNHVLPTTGKRID